MCRRSRKRRASARAGRRREPSLNRADQAIVGLPLDVLPRLRPGRHGAGARRRRRVPILQGPESLGRAALGRESAVDHGGERGAEVEAVSILELLDGLKQRDLLDRAQIVQCDGASVQLGPKLFATIPLTDAQEAEREASKVTLPNPDELLYGASEGV